MPSAENIEGKSPKVVVFSLNENDNEVAQNSHLGNTVANNIENMLTRDRLVELVDRSAAQKLQKEIALSEMSKTGSYKGPRVADYAISGSISNADFTSKYSAGSAYINPKTRQMVSIPPHFTYNSTVSGNIKIYELPSLKVVENIEFSGRKSRTENVRQNGGVSFGALQIGGQQVDGAKRDDGLVRKAGKVAINDSKIELKNAFAKKGYFLEKRTLEDKSIFKITLGSKDGIKQEDEFEVLGRYEIENPLTGETEIEHRIIATGKISNVINPKNSWVVLNEKEKVSAVRLGDELKIKYKRNHLEKLSRIAKDLTK
jgi:hypothetical protein